MVDQEARRQYAQLLRQFISRRMTNREYEAREGKIAAPGDRALREIASEVWMLYDDNVTHRMTGSRRLSRKARRGIARAVLFLHSDPEYGWPEDNPWGCGLAALLLVDVCAALGRIDRAPDQALSAVGVGVAVAVPLAMG